jgi:hypothetical protein
MNLVSEAPEEPAALSRRASATLATLRGLNVILVIAIGNLLLANSGAALGLALGLLVFFGRPILSALARMRDDWSHQRRQAAYRKARQ